MEQLAARHIIERVRSGLFDPESIQLITVGGERLIQSMRKGFGQSSHLCVCGAYGHGKSHSIQFLRNQLRQEGYATSIVSLDPRERPFHHLPKIYAKLMETLELPIGDDLISSWKEYVEKMNDTTEMIEELLPKTMPLRFRAILGAIARKNMRLSAKEKKLKKHKNFKPYRYDKDLKNGLEGHLISNSRLRNAFYYRQIPKVGKTSLHWTDPNTILQQLEDLASLLVSMGCKGLVLFCDEGESIVAVRADMRRKSFEILERWLFSTSDSLFSVFAFTEDALWSMTEEGFPTEKMNRYDLAPLSKEEWSILSKRVIQLHQKAYNWSVCPNFEKELQTKNQQIEGTRMRLRSLLEELDIQEQNQ